MATGTGTINFGSRSVDASVAVSAPTVTGASLVEAWIFPADTASNFIDNHWFDDIHLVAGRVVNGVGFTVYGTCKTGLAHGIFNFGWATK